MSTICFTMQKLARPLAGATIVGALSLLSGPAAGDSRQEEGTPPSQTRSSEPKRSLDDPPPEEGTTPIGMAVGSYGLGDVDHVNLFNGNLSLRMPLVNVQGRGESGSQVVLTVTQRWGVSPYPGISPLTVYPRFDWHRGASPGYGPGAMSYYQEVDTATGKSLVRLAFTVGDETQYDMRDTRYDGEPKPIGTNRGKVFKTYDGSAITYVSDQDVIDNPILKGRLLLPNGVQYRIDNGTVSWIRDRNGNAVFFSYMTDPIAQHPRLEGRQVTEIKDSLNRRVSFGYANVGDSVPKDVISFKGFQDGPRTIQVEYRRLASALNTGESLKTYTQLFPELRWAPAIANQFHNPYVVWSVTLPNNRAYVLRYSRYSEVAEATLPTGGKIAYVHGAGLSSLPPSGGQSSTQTIYRRVKERIVKPDGMTAEQYTTFGPQVDEALRDQSILVEHRIPGGGAISTETHRFHGRAHNNLTTGVFHYPAWADGREDWSEVSGGGAMRRVDLTWRQRAEVSWWTGSDDDEPANDPRLKEQETRLERLGAADAVSKQILEYDQYNNPTDVYEYDFGFGGPGPLVRQRRTVYVTDNNGVNYATDLDIHLRRLPRMEEILDSLGVVKARTEHAYDTHDTYPLVDRPGLSGRVNPEGHPVSYSRRGNVTAIKRSLFQTSETLVTSRQYDIAGNVIKEQSPRGFGTTGFETVFDFKDEFGSPDGDARNSQAPGDMGGQSSYAFATATTNPKGQITRQQYDYRTGLVVDAEDLNGVVASRSHADPLERLKEIVRAHSTAHFASRNRVKYQYDDAARTVTERRDQDGDDDGRIVTVWTYDGLGREASIKAFESGDVGIVTEKRYDARGRLSQVSNPYRSGEGGPDFTTTTFDGLDRVLTVTSPGPNPSVTTTSYLGNVATVADPASKKREIAYDVLGRVAWVREAPGGLAYLTNYTYDALGNLFRLSQGVQTRTFEYDSLSRLTSSTSPENGTVTYKYDANGNLRERLDTARNLLTVYEPDALDRTQRIDYPPGTPDVDYVYDEAPSGAPTVPYSVGRLVQITNNVAASRVDEYDPLGRIMRSSQGMVGGQSYGVSYTYDLADALRSQTYPSGRLVSTSRDQLARVSSVMTFTGTGSVTAGSFTYHPHGPVRDVLLGNSIWESTVYNEQLQPRFVHLGGVFTLENKYGDSGTNNGNVVEQSVQVGGWTATQSYSYDPANRLEYAVEWGSSWSQTYGHDQYGNRWISAGTVLEPDLTPRTENAFNPSNNRLIHDPDIEYDPAGNLKRDALGRAFTYDTENRQTSAGASTYEYDGNGRRVRKVVNGQSTVFVYDAFGKRIAEYGPGETFGTKYLTHDHLGSVRVATDATGDVMGRMDYLPYGEQIPASYGGRSAVNGYRLDPGLRPMFTGQDRDRESGLDHFKARYLSGAQGRFTSTDPLFDWQPTIEDPQRWNRYAYVRNNPTRYVDPDGQVVHAAVAAAWGLLEAGGTAYDAYDTYKTLRDPQASNVMKGISVAGIMAGTFLPGAGYGKAGKWLTNWVAGPGAAAMVKISPTVAELRKLGASTGFHVHHILPEYLGEMLGYTTSEMLKHPGALITQFRHTGKLNREAIHKAIAAAGLAPTINGRKVVYTVEQIKTGLQKAYNDLGIPEYFDEIADLIE